MQFVPIAPAHYRRMAALHAEGMAGGFLPSLGPRFLEALYTAMFGSGAARGAAAIEDDGSVVGFCYYTDDHHAFFARTLRRGSWRLAFWALVGFLRRPRLLLWLIETLRYQGRADVPGVSAEIYAWAVDPAYRRQRLGWAIVDATEAMMQAEGIRVYKHTVYDDNDKAIGFYEQRGHERVGSFELYGRRWALYRVDFATRKIRG
jgi:ribosomal protein S18 acetylase RimI-like enzyme